MTEYKKSLFYTVLFCFLITLYAAYDIREGYEKENSEVRSRVANTSLLIGEWLKGSFKASDYVLLDIISQIPLSELKYPNPDPTQQVKTTEFLKSKLETLPAISLV